jgi:deoxyribose-phosphate aldolase
MKDFESEHGLTHKSMRALKAGAARVGLHADSMTPADVASIIDHTLLRADATRNDLQRLCDEAREHGFATVCVNPAWVATASRLVMGSGVRVCSVVGFPLGATSSDVKEYETRRAIFDGATEIDMVINVGALKSGGIAIVEAEVAGVVGACHDAGALIKVIIEAALLTDEEKVAACRLAMDAGADYVKTSTGFGPGGATVADVALMRRVVGPAIGVKAAGGVRDYELVKALVMAGATRIGTSAGLKILAEAHAQKSGAQPPVGR